MIFTEFRFLAFFLIAFVVHWALRSQTHRKLWLLAGSYLFYAAWDWRFLSLILFSTGVDYLVGRALAIEDHPGRRKRWLWLSLVANLGLLGVFKYFNFFVDSAQALLTWLGLPSSEPVLRIALPVGISFYTLQTLSYSIDVFRRRCEPTRSLLDLALFVGFFPQLVAGPIVRAREFLPQLATTVRMASVDFRGCLTLFLLGFVKKAVVSDNLSVYVDRYFLDPGAYDALSAWLALFLYTIQIYCDFSGYSDMAIATAGMLGYRLRKNFDFPLVSTNIAEFWQRWHMSLATWLRDYVYIPLGGSRGSRAFTFRNVLLTFLISGLWHGAAWTFVAWGGMHGLAVLGYTVYRARLDRLGSSFKLPAPIAGALVLVFFALSLAYFRSPDFGHGTFIILAAFGGPSGETLLGDRLIFVLAALAVVHWVSYRRTLAPAWRALPPWAFGAALGTAWAITLSLVNFEAQPFIYFQF